MIHKLKIYPKYYQAVIDGSKNFEIRDNTDRGFQKGDTVQLQEYDPYLQEISGKGLGEWTGCEVMVQITYVSNYEQRRNFVVFGFSIMAITDIEQMPL